MHFNPSATCSDQPVLCVANHASICGFVAPQSNAIFSISSALFSGEDWVHPEIKDAKTPTPNHKLFLINFFPLSINCQKENHTHCYVDAISGSRHICNSSVFGNITSRKP